jgi:hypothetical protein
VEGVGPAGNVLIDRPDVGCEIRARFEAGVLFRNQDVVVVCDRSLVEDDEPVHVDGKLIQRDVELKCQGIKPWNVRHQAQSHQILSW